MSIESAKAFLERMKTDDEFRERMKEAADKEARMAIVKAEGFDFTMEEIATLKEELSDIELDMVAAGSSKCWRDGKLSIG